MLQTNGSGVLSFAAVGAAAGQVIQVVTATDSTSRTNTSASYVTASNTLSVTITPSSASNKIYLLANVSLHMLNASRLMYATIFKDGVNLVGANGIGGSYVGSGDAHDSAILAYLDSPSTTSATTYQVYVKNDISGQTGTINIFGMLSSITAFEIKG